MTDAEIIHTMQSENQNKALKELYKFFPSVRKMIRDNNGSKDDAEDIYQESLIILFRKVKEKDFQLTSSLNTFLFSISRLQWLGELRKRKKEFKTGNADEIPETDVENLNQYLQEEEKFKNAETALIKLGEKCRELLQLFYSQNKSFKEIAEKLGFASEKVAKNQKYRCMEKAKENYLNSEN